MKILCFSNIFPSYRRELWDNLLTSNKFEIHFYFSDKLYHDIGTANFNENFNFSKKKRLHQLQNYSFKGNIIFQSKVLKILSNNQFDSVIFLGDMKIISNWLGIVICKLRRKKIIFWTHGIYGKERWLVKKIRLFFLSLSDQLLLYESRAKNILIDHNFSSERLHVVYNSIHLKEQTLIYNKLTNKNQFLKKDNLYNLLFFGRLTKTKKVDLLINALKILNKKNIKYKLKIIGNGNEKEYLNSLVVKHELQNCIKFIDATYDENLIGNFFLEADLLVSPGNVGLNAIHSLSYGTPVLTHGNFSNQMPEHEAIIPNFNGCFHVENDILSIAKKIQDWFALYHLKYTRNQIRNNLIEKYNPDVQLKIFENVLVKN